MNTLGVVLAMGAGVYALRLAGLALRDLAVPEAWERSLRFVPVALLTALVVLSVSGAGRADVDLTRVAAAATGALAAWRTRRLWVCIVAGMAAFWLLRLL